MADMNADYAELATPLRRVSWPAIFGGTLVALATEILFATFGTFIGFVFTGAGATETWTEIWYLLTSLIALYIGGWVAGRSAPLGMPRVQGAVTWGLTTLATFLIAVWMFWGVVSASLTAVQTTVAATNHAAATAPPQASADAHQLQNQVAAGATSLTQHPAALANRFAGDAEWIFGIVWSGVFLGCVGALAGSSMAGRQAGISVRPAFNQSARPASA